jgi:hypothetical protein
MGQSRIEKGISSTPRGIHQRTMDRANRHECSIFARVASPLTSFPNPVRLYSTERPREKSTSWLAFLRPTPSSADSWASFSGPSFQRASYPLSAPTSEGCTRRKPPREPDTRNVRRPRSPSRGSSPLPKSWAICNIPLLGFCVPISNVLIAPHIAPPVLACLPQATKRRESASTSSFQRASRMARGSNLAER